MKYEPLMMLICFMLLGAPLSARQYKVAGKAEFDRTVSLLQPGDSLVMKAGVWKDAALRFYGAGSAAQPIVLCAEQAGQVRMEGRSELKLAGSHLHISGLVFVNGYAVSSIVVEFRIPGQGVAENCTLSECVIDSYNKPQNKREQWIQVYGRNNAVGHCYLAGKTNPGMTLAVRLDASSEGDYCHRIYRNYFGVRPPVHENGGETIQIGLAEVAEQNCRTVVEENFFEHCDGEIEVISVKSSENKIANNVFYECVGMVTLRHGHRNQVYGNLFLGNGVKGTGGVRVINYGQEVFNNLFYRLTGQGTASALTVLNGIPGALPKEYMQVRDARIYNNTFYECATPWHLCFGSSAKRSLRPVNTYIVNNLVYCPGQETLIKEYDSTDSIRFENNLLVSRKGFGKEAGGIKGKISVKQAKGLEYAETRVRSEEYGFMMNSPAGRLFRGNKYIGAVQPGMVLPAVPDRSQYGPSWYHVK